MDASVIIPNWNGAHLLAPCLDSLRRQTWQAFEVIVVDNASTDGSVELISRDYPEVRVISLPSNRGFSAAVNEGIRQSSSEMIVLLNNDTEADSRWLAELHHAFYACPQIGWFASKILLYDRREAIHSAGDYYRIDGIPGNRGVWERDEGLYDSSRDVFGACAAAAVYRRSMLQDIGLFDEDLVAYCEDVDLNFRAQLAGYRCLFIPSAIVYHRLSATGGGSLASYYCGRNFIITYLRNMPGPLLRRHWPKALGAQLALTLDSLRHLREPAARARLRGQLAAFLALPATLRTRKKVQHTRRVSIEYLESLLQHPQ